MLNTFDGMIDRLVIGRNNFLNTGCYFFCFLHSIIVFDLVS